METTVQGSGFRADAYLFVLGVGQKAEGGPIRLDIIVAIIIVVIIIIAIILK